jgi:E3 ubiquitin-protein ligase SHPRH
LINTALELQAIARVHRIGQYLPTTVWMYIVEDTVEKAIYDISVQRRLAHITQVGEERKKLPQDPKGKGKARADLVLEDELEAVNSLELRDAPLAKLLEKGAEGELVDRDDLWSCLFSHKATNRVEERLREVGKQLRADAAEERAVREAGRKAARKETGLS